VTTTPTRPPSASLAERVYRRLLRLLPPDFRGEFGDSMARDFHDRDRDLAGASRRQLWSREVPALVLTTVAQWGDAAWRDVRFTLRIMARAPGFSLAAVLMLAIGTGANAAMFSVLDAVLLRSAYPDAGRIVTVLEGAPGRPSGTAIPVSHLDRLARAPGFTAVAGLTGSESVLTGAGEPRRLAVECVSASMFRLLGVPAALGRVFTGAEDRVGGPPVVVLGYRTWRETFSGAPDIVGRSITLNNVPNTVIGVMPDGFLGPEVRNKSGAWAPLAPAIGQRSPAGCVVRLSFVTVIARVAAPLTLDEAAARANASGVLAGLTAWNGAVNPRLELARADDYAYTRLRAPLAALLGAVACVLLIACANVANLQLERLVGRRREIAIRLALGATRSRIVRQTIVENLLVSVIGADAGLLAARLSLRAIVGLIPLQVPHVQEIAVNGRTLAVTLAAALAAGLGVGLLPALQATRQDVAGDLGQSSRSVVGGTAWTRRGLVVIEVALSVVLLVAAGLMLRTFLVLRPVDPGFAASNRTVAEMVFDGPWHIDPSREQTVDAAMKQIGDLRGVAGVSATSYLPLSGVTDLSHVTIGAESTDVWSSWSTPSYFRDMDMRLRRGRWFTDADTPAAAPVAMVNEAMATRFWAGADPLGRLIDVEAPDGTRSRRQIVGILETTRSWGTDMEQRSELYMPYRQGPGSTLIYFIVRTNGRAAVTLPAEIRTIVSTIRPGQIVDRIEPLQASLDRSVSTPRFAMWLFGVFAVAGGVLAAIGLAAVVAWWVTERRREIGVRIALGASVERVVRLVLREGLLLATAGVGIGIGAAALVTRVLRDWLYGVAPPTDPLTFALCAAGMLGVTAMAAWLPARRVARVDPIVSLRSE
jgi:putative ABC transport system permease protein